MNGLIEVAHMLGVKDPEKKRKELELKYNLNEEKEKIKINPNVGNVPAGIEHFNNSTFSSSEVSVAEALKELNELEEAKSKPKQLKGQKKFKQKENNKNQLGKPIGLHPIPKDYNIETTSDFDKDFKRLHLTQEDLEEIKEVIKSHSARANIKGFTQKFDWTPKRSNLPNGEYRTYCIRVIKSKKAYLCRIYAKNQIQDLSNREKENITRVADLLNKEK